ncbi:MAG: YbgC/FadM family acyl-CoA thioesterase [Deltaproteobacteria bacterium]
MDVRIYYEDTDAAGVVYHANYLKYFERARSEFLREHGVSIASLASDGFVFPVVRVSIDFRRPAFLDDLISINTVPENVKGSSFAIKQHVIRKSDGLLLVAAVVTLACIGPEFKARRIPAIVRDLLDKELKNAAGGQ